MYLTVGIHTILRPWRRAYAHREGMGEDLKFYQKDIQTHLVGKRHKCQCYELIRGIEKDFSTRHW